MTNEKELERVIREVHEVPKRIVEFRDFEYVREIDGTIVESIPGPTTTIEYYEEDK